MKSPRTLQLCKRSERIMLFSLKWHNYAHVIFLMFKGIRQTKVLGCRFAGTQYTTSLQIKIPRSNSRHLFSKARFAEKTSQCPAPSKFRPFRLFGHGVLFCAGSSITLRNARARAAPGSFDQYRVESGTEDLSILEWMCISFL